MNCLFATVFAAILLVESIAREPQDKEVLERMTKICAEGTSITYDDVMQQFKEKFQGPLDYPMKCFFKCVMQHEGWMTADGEIKLYEEMQKDFGDCTKMGDDLCERAYLFHKCIYDKNGGERMFGKILHETETE